MAAGMPMLVDLRQVSVAQVEDLLAEQVAVWRDRFDWDLAAAVEMVMRLVRAQDLGGFALLDGSSVSGYCYFVSEERKGLIGDLYVANEKRAGGENEVRLLAAALRALATTPNVTRAETQFLVLSHEARARMPFPMQLHSFERHFMKADMSRATSLPESAGAAQADYFNWHPRERESAARLIARAYADHVDSRINDHYRTIGGARKFLENVLEYPGCGSFYEPASLVALDKASGRLLGVCLSSLVAFDVGHITQVCVSPEAQGRGVGYELVRRAAGAFGRANCRAVSLTVTAANLDAVRLYGRMGFSSSSTFEAFVWEKLGL